MRFLSDSGYGTFSQAQTIADESSHFNMAGIVKDDKITISSQDVQYEIRSQPIPAGTNDAVIVATKRKP